MTFGEICNANVQENLLKRFKLFDRESNISFSQESYNILKALSYYTEKSTMYCENLICKEMQHRISQTSTRWVDSYFHDQQGIYNAVRQKNNVILQLTTTSTVNNIKIPTSFYNKLFQAFHEDTLSQSSGIFNITTQDNISKKHRKRSSYESNVRFKPFDSSQIGLSPNKVQNYLNLEKLVMNSLGHH
jgi:hypothetical protein